MDEYYNEINFPVKLPDTGGNWELRANPELSHVAYIARPDKRGCLSGGFGTMKYTLGFYGPVFCQAYRKGDL